MKRNFLLALALASLLLVVSLGIGRVRAQVADFDLRRPSVPAEAAPTNSDLRNTCALQPEPKTASRSARLAVARASQLTATINLSRFRQDVAPDSSDTKAVVANRYRPREEMALIDSTNYGDRYLKDLNGNPAIFDPIVVLHETVGSAESAIGFFRTPHPRDADQASYHTLVRQNGTVVYLVPPDKRAFGAGNSTFNGLSVRTNPDFPGSVNNFAYHVSLETPPDGSGNSYRHSGYTQAQYQSLAWLIAKTGVPSDRITTHRAVDRSGSRIDPRSFQFSQFMALLNTYPRTTDISIRCADPTELPSP